MDWSPKSALDAYLRTLHLLSKVEEDNAGGGGSRRVVEPKCIELISAMAAGKGAKSILEITTQGVTPLTMALGVAANQNGGQLTCINVTHTHRSSSDDSETSSTFKHKVFDHLQHVVKLVEAYGCPCDTIVELNLNNIDFAVIDCKFEDHLKVFKKLDVNPNGSTVIVHNQHSIKPAEVDSFAQVVKRRMKRVESVTLPIGEGIELTTIGSTSSSTHRMEHVIRRKHKRFHVTFED